MQQKIFIHGLTKTKGEMHAFECISMYIYVSLDIIHFEYNVFDVRMRKYIHKNWIVSYVKLHLGKKKKNISHYFHIHLTKEAEINDVTKFMQALTK